MAPTPATTTTPASSAPQTAIAAPSTTHPTTTPGHGGHGDHAGHGGHVGHAEVFRRRFWISLILAVPVVLYSQMVMELFTGSRPASGAQTRSPSCSARSSSGGAGGRSSPAAVDEIRRRQPGMMLLVGMAISVAYGASLATEAGWIDIDLWFEVATLIVIMLLGHWQEMKALGQARGALDALAELLPDDAERITGDRVETVVARRPARR